jgi:hypothetical protein
MFVTLNFPPRRPFRLVRPPRQELASSDIPAVDETPPSGAISGAR